MKPRCGLRSSFCKAPAGQLGEIRWCLHAMGRKPCAAWISAGGGRVRGGVQYPADPISAWLAASPTDLRTCSHRLGRTLRARPPIVTTVGFKARRQLLHLDLLAPSRSTVRSISVTDMLAPYRPGVTLAG